MKKRTVTPQPSHPLGNCLQEGYFENHFEPLQRTPNHAHIASCPRRERKEKRREEELDR
jgi:hypothetical protein